MDGYGKYLKAPPSPLPTSNIGAVSMAALASCLHLSAPLFKLSASSSRWKAHPNKQNIQLRVRAAKSKGKDDESGEDPSVPAWARPGSNEPPPWAQKDTSGFEVPFYVYLIASSITAIAAIGSIFEYVNEKPVFGVLSSDSLFYAPVLGFFVFTGIPSSAFLWYKSVQAANKEAEEQDRRDGFL